MKAKRFLALILALVMALSLVACGDSGKTPAADGDSNGGGDSSFPKMTWTAATSGAEGSNFDVGLEKFSELLQEKTNGAVKLDIYCSDQLTNGSTADSVQACMDGTIDVTFQADGIWGNFDTVFNIPNLPFLFDSYDDVDSKLINGEGGKYLMKAKAEDVTEDWRIQNVWNGTIETYQEYQRLKDVDKAKANAFKNSKTNKRLFAARKAISAARRKMNKAKKQMDGTNDAAKLVEIRNTRKELLKTLNGME